MKNYKITFTPREPYFFGNEKSFKYPGQTNTGSYANMYFIKSENMPSQSTILGALRYIVLPVKRDNFQYSPEEISLNQVAAGKSSFNIESEDVQAFGAIKSISPVFVSKEDKTFVPLPLNHKLGEDSYNPFKEYATVRTPDGDKLYALDYSAKDGLAENAFVDLDDGTILKGSELFNYVTRVGINRGVKTGGFFKKEYVSLEEGYAFSVYAEIDETILKPEILSQFDSEITVFLGQNKSAFTVKFAEAENNLENEVREKLSSANRNFDGIYVLGDCLAFEGMYDDVQWSAIATKDYRTFMRNTDSGGKVEKGTCLHRLIKAGSVFITDKPDQWMRLLEQNTNYKNAKQIGYCTVVKIGG